MLEDDHSKKCANIERCTQLGRYFTFKPIRKKVKFLPWVLGYVHHRLKRGHPGHTRIYNIKFLTEFPCLLRHPVESWTMLMLLS